MSKSVDEKVVQMKFDNRQFEQGVKETMSTLDKFKQKLNLTGASKGLDDVQKSAQSLDRNMSFNNAERSLTSLEKRFSALGIAGMTVIQNLTNSMMNFASKINSFGLGGIIQGGNARAMKIENAQFQIKGLLRDAENAEQKLKDIMKDVNYGVEDTAYGLDAAATVAAQLVASGIEAGQTMQNTLRGISGVAAMTNSTYEEIGMIYTKIAGNGRLMGEELLQLSSRGMNAAATIGKYLGKTESEVRDLVSKGKIDFETFANAMDSAFGEHAKEANRTFNGVVANIKAALAKIGAEFFRPLKAEDSPLVKFLNSIRERINDIKKTLDPITKEVTTRINNIITAIDNLFKNSRDTLGFTPLKGILQITEKIGDRMETIHEASARFANRIREIESVIDKAIAPVREAGEAVDKVTSSIEDCQKIVDEVIYGSWGNGQTRFDKLTESGINYYRIQNMVNEQLECSYRYSEDLVNQQDELLGINKKVANSTERLDDSEEDLLKTMQELSDEQLKQYGMTDEQVSAFRELNNMAKKTGLSMSYLLDIMQNGNFSSRFLIFNSIKNIGSALVTILQSLAKAFTEVFSIDATKLFDIVAGFHKITVSIREFVEKHADKLTETFKGIFSVVHMLVKLITGALKIGIDIINKILDGFGISILDVTGKISGIIQKIDQWVTSDNGLIAAIKVIVDWMSKYITIAIDWIKNNEKIQKIVESIKNAFSNIGESFSNWVQGLKETDNIPQYIFEGLVNGIKSIGPKIWEAVKSIAEGIIETIKKVLGIHSPSKVMYDIGKNTSEGLVNGIKSIDIGKGFEFLKNIIVGLIEFIKNAFTKIFDNDVAKKIFDGIKNFFTKIGDFIKKQLPGLKNMINNLGDIITNWLKKLNINKVLDFAVIIMIISILKKIVAAVNDMSSAITGLVKGVTGTINSINKIMDALGAAAKKFGDAAKREAMAHLITSLVALLAALVSAIVVLGGMKRETLIQGGIALAALLVVMGALFGFLTFLSTKFGSLPKMGGVFLLIIGFSVGISLIGKAIAKVASMPVDNIMAATKAIMAVMGGLLIMLLVFSTIMDSYKTFNRKGPSKIDNLVKTILGISVAMLLIATALKKMNSVEWSSVGKMSVMMLELVGLLVIIGVINKFSKGSLNKAAGTIMAIGASLLLLTFVMKMSSNLKPEAFKNTFLVIQLFVAMLTELLIVSKIFEGTELIKLSASVIALGVVIGLLALSVKMLGGMDMPSLIKGLAAVIVLGLLIKELIKVSRDTKSFQATTLIGAAFAIIAMAGAVFLLGQMKVSDLAKGIAAVGVITLFIKALIESVKLSDGQSFSLGSITSLIGVAIAIAVLAGVLIILTFIKWQKLLSATVALASVVGALVVLIKVVEKMKLKKGTFTNLFTMILVIGALTGIMILLAKITDPTKAAQGAIGLSVMMLAMSGVLFILSKMKVKTSDAIKGALALTMMAIPLLAFIGVLYVMEKANLTKALPNIMSLIIITTAMTALLAVLALIANLGIQNMLLGVIGLTAMAIPLLAFVGVLALMQHVDKAMDNVKALTFLAAAMTLLLIPLTAIGAIMTTGIGAIAVVAGILALTAMAIPLLAFVGVLALMQHIEGATENVMLLTTMMEKLTECLFKISLVGPLALIADVAIFGMIQAMTAVGTFATAVGFLMDKFPSLEKFLNKGLPILEQIALSIGKIFGNVIAGFINGVTSELPHLGMMLSNFAILSMPFFTLMSTIDGNKVLDGIKSVALSILALCGAQIVDGVTRFLGLGRSFVDMGKDLAEFGNSVLPFLLQMANVPVNATDGIKNIAQAIEALSKSNLFDAIGKNLFGQEKDITQFGSQLEALGEGITGFSNALGEGVDNDKVSAGAEAVKTLAEAAKDLPATGGIWQALAGEKDMDSFSKNAPKLGEAINGFCKNLGDNLDTEKVKAGAEAVSTLAKAAKDLPKEDGLWQAIVGEQDLSSFKDKFPDLGKGIAGFADSLKDTNLDSVKVGTDMVRAIADLGKEGGFKQGKSLEEFGACFISFCNKLTEAIQSLGQINGEDLPNQLNKIKSFGDVATEIVAIDKSKLEEFGESVKGLGSAGVDAFVNSMTGDEAKGKAKDSVNGFIDSAKDSVTDDKKQSISDKFKEVSQSALDGLNDYGNRYQEFYDSGVNFVQGFADGISKNIYIATAASSALGRRSVESLNESVDENSPSKITAKSGRYFTIGFINGINEYASKAGDAAASVGSYATKGLQNAVSKVYDAMSSDIDNQPTIRPVLDLSEIEAGASTLNSMLDINKNLALSANLSSISTSINRRLQNRGNDDVISAIKDLSKSISGSTGDTYNVNGINYSDDAEISDAIRTLVKASVVERRT